ncbi:adenylosuccinate synthase [Leptospira ognonensis]|uniref:Adenylosuccinate synthetase n=1 Tax=Leptospira ognonensis TaxID=2484945 RepID=A0A4R9K024_9LEPT|nr:adenylosuccinate synthase [Leptospira ognonensis]TGL57268.1 adenylosuccinate synthase [Leptospira ognonensis]
MPANLVVGAQWGDEGKAKVIDYLSKDTDIIVRYQGGANAGHTVVVGGNKYVFHLVPSGIIYDNTVCVIGNGVVLDPEYFLQECADLEKSGFKVKEKVLISDSCHILLPHHRLIDEVRELGSSPEGKIGTTKKGIGMCYADKMLRIGLRAGDLLDKDMLKRKLTHILDVKNQELVKYYDLEPVRFDEIYKSLLSFADQIGNNIVNTIYYLNDELDKGKRVLLEGAQGTGLDIDFGTYPYVTSSNPTTGGALAGSGVNFRHLKDVIGITKAYATRVGEGPFPSEIMGEAGEILRKLGGEYGSTTGRPRRCGWFDVQMIKHSIVVNGINSIVLTKIDVLSHYDTIPVVVGYEYKGKRVSHFPSQGLEDVKPVFAEFKGWKDDISGISDFSRLPASCQSYINTLQELVGTRIGIVSTGPDRDHTIIMK